MAQQPGACAFCGGPLAAHWHSQAFSRCRDCGLIARSPLPTPEQLKAFYENAWQVPHGFRDGDGSMGTDVAREYSRSLLRSLQRSDAKGLRILDFGAGLGELVEALGEAGAEVHAIEPYGYDYLRDKARHLYASLDDLPEGLTFHGVVTMDVVEHLLRPWEVFERLHQRLEPGGWLCVATPNPAGLRARLRGAQWDEAQKESHIVFMDERTLTRMLERAGFKSTRPLRWEIRYRSGLGSRLAQGVLLATGLHGSARVLAFK